MKSPRNSGADGTKMIRRISIAMLVTACFMLAGLLLLAWRPSIAPIEPPSPSTFSAELVAKGEALSAVGHCAACHTQPGGQPFAGGYRINTPFGAIFGTNITPDPKTGIGVWSLEAFTRAMREGVARDGSHLMPAFPYYAFTKLSDDDVKGLYAYLMTRPAVNSTVPNNTLPFPLNIRAFQEGWKILFFRSARYQADQSKSAEWNRGAYLAEGLADCSGCHTPRNPLGAEETGHAYAGAVIEGWIAPALTEANPSPVPWTQEELFTYLRTGVDLTARGDRRHHDSSHSRGPRPSGRAGLRYPRDRSLLQRDGPCKRPCQTTSTRPHARPSRLPMSAVTKQRMTPTLTYIPPPACRATTMQGQLHLRRVRNWRSTVR